MALLILALLQRIFLMSSLMLLLVWLIFFMVLIKLLPILGTISGKTVKLMVLALICLGNNRQDRHPPNCMFSCLQILEAFLWFVLRDENAHNDKSVHGVLNPTYQAGLRRDAVQPDIEAERKKRDEIEAGKSYCSRRFGGATCDDKSAQIYARFDKNDWRIQPAEFYRFHDAEVNTFGYF